MNQSNEKEEFYKIVNQAILVKGEEWFNAWSESNPITNFQFRISDNELSEMILDSEVSNIASIDYQTMKNKLAADMRGN